MSIGARIGCIGGLMGWRAGDFRAAQRALVIEGGMFLRVEGQWIGAWAFAYPRPETSERGVSLQIVRVTAPNKLNA